MQLDQIPEDLHFVLRMRHMFESLGYQSGFYLSQLFSSTRNTAPSSSAPPKQIPTRPPPPIFNWSHPPLPGVSPISAPTFHPAAARMGLPNHKDDTHLFLLPPSSESHMEEMMPDHDADLKWPNGLSFFTALTGRQDDAKLLFGSEALGGKPPVQQHPLVMAGKSPASCSAVNFCGNMDESKPLSDASNLHSPGNRGDNSISATNDTEDYLGLESHTNKARKVDSSKFKRSFTLPARMTSSSSSSSLEHHHSSTQHGVEYRGSEAGIYSDIMETFLE